MKAQQYADELKRRLNGDYSEGNVLVVVDWLIKSFFHEVGEIADKRKSRLDGAMVAILKEQDQKWKAVNKRFPNFVNPDGFYLFIKDKMDLDFRL